MVKFTCAGLLLCLISGTLGLEGKINPNGKAGREFLLHMKGKVPGALVTLDPELSGPDHPKDQIIGKTRHQQPNLAGKQSRPGSDYADDPSNESLDIGLPKLIKTAKNKLLAGDTNDCLSDYCEVRDRKDKVARLLAIKNNCSKDQPSCIRDNMKEAIYISKEFISFIRVTSDLKKKPKRFESLEKTLGMIICKSLPSLEKMFESRHKLANGDILCKIDNHKKVQEIGVQVGSWKDGKFEFEKNLLQKAPRKRPTLFGSTETNDSEENTSSEEPEKLSSVLTSVKSSLQKSSLQESSSQESSSQSSSSQESKESKRSKKGRKKSKHKKKWRKRRYEEARKYQASAAVVNQNYFDSNYNYVLPYSEYDGKD